MKKYICFAAALAIVGAASCNKELVDNNAPEVPEVKIATLTATIGEPDTKTTLAAPEDAHTSGSAVHWAAEDALSVFDGASNVKYTIKTEEDVDYTPATTAVFEGEELAEAEGYYALYPYTSTASLAEGVIKGAVLPATQTAVAGNIPADAALAVAYTEDRETIYFKNVATIIGFTLTEAAEKVEFVAKGDVAIAGTIDVTINEGLPTYTVQEETGSNKVTLKNLAAGTYYFTILPDVTLTQGYEFYIGGELAKSKADELTLVRSKVYSLGEVKVPLKDRELSFSPASYEITWGDDFTEPILNGTYTEVTYSSDNEEVATVAADGTLDIKKAGEVTITATVDADEKFNAGSASYKLVIKKATRTLNFAVSTVYAILGENYTRPNLTGMNDGENVFYTSSNPSIATVAADGTINLVSEGMTTITATADPDCLEGSAYYTLNVQSEGDWNLRDTDNRIVKMEKSTTYTDLYVAENVSLSAAFKFKFVNKDGSKIVGAWGTSGAVDCKNQINSWYGSDATNDYRADIYIETESRYDIYFSPTNLDFLIIKTGIEGIDSNWEVVGWINSKDSWNGNSGYTLEHNYITNDYSITMDLTSGDYFKFLLNKSWDKDNGGWIGTSTDTTFDISVSGKQIVETYHSYDNHNSQFNLKNSGCYKLTIKVGDKFSKAQVIIERVS